MDSQKRIPIKSIIWKFINSLPPKYVKLLTIIGSNTLKEAVEAAIDVEANQKVKAHKKDQAYMVNTIEELHQEVHNLQVAQTKSQQSKLVTPVELLQGIRD